MRLLIIFFLIIFISNVTGQTIQGRNYSCNVNEFDVKITLSSSSHSAWEPTTNCFLSQCNVNSNNNASCRSSSTPCFDYRTVNNISVCAPGILCSILESCNNITNQCASNNSVCIINSCCLPRSVCLPQSVTSLCTSATTSTPPTPINVGSSSTLLSISSTDTTAYTWYYYEWTALDTGNVTLTFELRNDPDTWYLDDVSVSNGGTEILVNGNFESGNLSPWVVTFRNGPCYGARICQSRQYTGNYDCCDSCRGITHEISQSFMVTAGQAYVISFWLATGTTDPVISALVTITANIPPCTPINVGSSSTLLSISSANTTTYTCYCYEWTALDTGNVTLTFELRNDPDTWYLDDVSVSNGGTEILMNGNFESGNLSPWVVTFRNGPCNGARICVSRQYTGNYVCCDSCIRTTHEISQSFMVTAGQAYVISFWLATGTTGPVTSALVTITANIPPCTPINVGSSSTLLSVSSANTTTYTCYCYEWTALDTDNVTLTFELRNDPDTWYLDDVSVSNGGTEILVNGNFESGNLSPWVVTFRNGPCNGARICQSRQYTGNYVCCDSCIRTTHEISQSFMVTAGQAYVISFWLATGTTDPVTSALATITANIPPCTPVNVGSSSTLLSLSSANTTTYTCYCYEWTALDTGNVTLTFELRNDPDIWYLDDVSVSNGGTEILMNGNFESGNLAPWVVTFRNGLCNGARICQSRQYTGNYDCCDSCRGITHEISQSFMVTAGQAYVISFWLATGTTDPVISALVTITANIPPCTPINVGSSSTLLSISSANTTTYTCYCYEWTALDTDNVTLTFELRNDPDTWYLDDVSVSNGGTEILVNGNFESGNLSPWVVTFRNGPCNGARICQSRQYTGNYVCCDSCIRTTHEISQSFMVTAGQAYVISFWLATGTTGPVTSALVTITANIPPCTPINVGSSSTLLSVSSANTTTYTCYCYEWTALDTGNVTLTFELRNDPDTWYLDDVSVSNGGTEILVNGNFESGNLSPWVVTLRNGPCNGARICVSRQYTGNYDCCDSCRGVTDEISQSFMVTAGQAYVISFWLATGTTDPVISALVTIS